MSVAQALFQSAAAPADGLGSEGQQPRTCDPTVRCEALAGIGHPFTTRHRIDLRQLQAQWEEEADRARFAALLATVRARGPDGLPLWVGAMLVPAALALAAFAAAIARGAL